MTENLPENLIVFAHGKESGPWGRKITHLAGAAEQRGFAVLSPDYSHTHDPQARIAQLIALKPQARRLVLAGSSMGGYVSAMACAALKPRALLLIAPALYFPRPGWDGEPEGIPKLCAVVHGWHDDIVPLAQAQRFAQKHSAALHVLDSGHTLNDQLDMLALLLDRMLVEVLAA
jgi:alpha/beta superfamily hydrolase